MPKPTATIDPVRTLQADKGVLEARRLQEAGKIDQAAALVAQIVQAEPTHVGALRLMGRLAMQTGATDIGIVCFSRALAVTPRSFDILLELGNALLAGQRPAEALTAFKKGLTLRPNDSALFRGLGQAQLDMGSRADALKSFRKTLSILPYDQYAAHMIAALTGEASKASAGYVPDLFDTYANIFDEHLTGTLEYRVPGLIRETLLARKVARLRSMLDIGCGTGLTGAALQDIVAEKDGIDISPKMIRKALERDVYRYLRTGDAVEAMAADANLAGPYDLVTAADVFIYIGPLEAVFTAVSRALAPAGLFAFSMETVPGDHVVVRSSGRFAHPNPYIASLAAENRFAIVEQRDIQVRRERNLPIAGTLYLLARN